MGIVEQYLLKLNTKKMRFFYAVLFLSLMSILVVFAVLWNLRQTGITLANDASCGYKEHRHTEECAELESVLICGFGEAEPTATPEPEPTATPEAEPTATPAPTLPFTIIITTQTTAGSNATVTTKLLV